MEPPSSSFASRRPAATDLPNFALPPPDVIPVALNRLPPSYFGSSSATHGTFGPSSTPGSSGSSYSYGSASAASTGLSQHPFQGRAPLSSPSAPSPSKTLKPTDSSSHLPPSPKWPLFPPKASSGPTSSSSSYHDPGPGPSYGGGITMTSSSFFPLPQQVTFPLVDAPPSAASSLSSLVRPYSRPQP